MNTQIIDLSIPAEGNLPDYSSSLENMKEKLTILEVITGSVVDIVGKISAKTETFQRADLTEDISELHNSLLKLSESAVNVKISAEVVSALPFAIRISSSHLPDPGFHYALGSYLLNNKQTHEAIWAFEQAIALKPDFLKAKMKLGNAKLQIDLVDEAILLYKEVVASGQELEEIYNKLGFALCRRLRYHEAREAFHKNLLARHGLSIDMQRKYTRKYSKNMPIKPDSHTCSAFKSKAIHEQLLFLLQQKIIHPSYYELAHQYNWLYKETKNFMSTELSTKITLDQLKPFNGYYDKVINYAVSPRIKGNTLNSSVNYVMLEEEFINNQVIYYDNFLSPETLASLRYYFNYSTVFFRASNAGFVGSYLNDGFDCDLIYQIIEELHERFPNILKNKRLHNMACYKYDKEGSGVRSHCDRGAVTFNFWLTDDKANLIPDSGGLIVYDKEHPDCWDRSKTNMYKDDPSVQDQIQQYLCDAKSVKIPYRCNRVVIFKSTLFHKTDPYSFKDNFESRRMNISLWFGKSEKESTGERSPKICRDAK